MREVDPFIGHSFACGSISETADDLRKWADSLVLGNKARSMMQQKLAAEQCARLAGQIKVLADVLARVSAERLNRKEVRV